MFALNYSLTREVEEHERIQDGENEELTGQRGESRVKCVCACAWFD